MAQGLVIPMPQPAVDPAVKENLGSKISAIVQTYNDLHKELIQQPDSPTKAQLVALLEKRRAAVEDIRTRFKAVLDALFGAVQPKLQGFQVQDVNQIQSELDLQQSKLAALQTYFEQYKTAIASGSQPPALPAELQEGSFGISATTLAILAALAAGAYFLWFNKE
jgi:LmbE family N-acetylglucosaminyl deacetylase